ncbi:hypothetical protein GCM10011581_24910 [Saccharopolyspora subtropica]|uniref:ESAT-6 protein secretion system EspG family protein n=1 Tax=Saccharopolyspora thermophila TaxID=89367 RepID=A0A917JVP0_9PSEU|nr:ESX secretion-associated protein EspG [Saccharopolyspora subtropica]GGI86822.1 hypothetical protein GCM10011581_24910 [Saccharopolyspora subtropica]
MTAATAPTGRSILFGQVELDLIAAHAGVPFPFPLQIPSFGRIDGEREVLMAAAGRTLQLRGLADEDGPAGAAAELVTALREHRGTVDLVVVDGDGATGVVAVVYRSWALICQQRLDGDPATPVRIRRVAAKDLTDPLLAEVPELAAARSMPIALPERALTDAVRLIGEIDDDAEKQRFLRDLVHRRGGDPAALDRLAALLPTLSGRGQLGATRRVGGRSVRVGRELSWLDGPQGRVRVDRSDRGWVSVNPLRGADFRFALEELASLAREPRRPGDR